MLFNNTNMRTAMAYTNAVGDKVYPIIVDIKKGIKSTEEVSFVSSDINTGVLSVAFIQGNDTYNVEGAEVICSIMRPDTTTLEIPCNTVNGNTIEVPLGVNGTSQDGVYSFDFKVFKGGNKIVGTPIMNYSVSLSISNDLVVEEDDRLPVLTMLMTQLTELKEETRETINQANVATVASREATANAIEATNNANAVSERVSQETATAISEIRQDTANAIASMNQSTSTAISTMNQSTTDAIDSMNQNTTNAIASMTQKTDEALANMNQSATDAVTNMTQKTDEAVTSMNQNTTNAIADMTQKTNEVVTMVNDNLTNINNVVTTKVAELDNAKSDMTTTVSNKVNEVETRFNALTSQQQQSSEVIDARDGETSLKARLDRDIEKAKQVYVNVEGSYVSTDSSVGYAKDVEILGNTIQDASNLADIRSVGDKVEGQELYEIPVLSVGKNLFDASKLINGKKIDNIGNVVNGLSNESYIFIKVPSVKLKYSISKVGGVSNPLNGTRLFAYDKNLKLTRVIGWMANNNGDINLNSNETYIGLSFMYSDTTGTSLDCIKTIQLEEGTVATPYEPYQEDKLTILSPVQLERVGNVADRIIEKDGVWGVEKNNDEIKLDEQVFNGGEVPVVSGEYVKLPIKYSTCSLGDSLIEQGYCITTFGARLNSNEWANGTKEGIYIGKNAFGIVTKIETIGGNTKTHMKNYFSNKNHKFKRSVANPTFIPLPHDQQVKLRTFANKTNISFGCEIEGTIKAQVPKSLGATVNTHTEQIRSLNNELNRVKKLEESTVSTVTTESGFTTVEATSNGYFEDVKLEGKTLVNLSNLSRRNITITKNDSSCKITPLRQLTSSDVLYLSFNCTSLTFDSTFGIIYSITYSDGTPTNYIEIPNGKVVGYKQAKIVPKGNVSSIAIYLHSQNSSDSKATISDVVLMYEKDYDTQNPPSYFEGLKSVGDVVDEVSVESVDGDGNLFNVNTITENYYIDKTTGNLVSSENFYVSDFIPCTKDIIYYHNRGEGTVVCFYDKNRNYVSYSEPQSKFTSPVNGYFRIHCKYSMKDKSEFMVCKGSMLDSYQLYRSDKKQLLYYNNETQIWEKPVLRVWDSIEKHADGKYYYHKRSEEVVLNGSENISSLRTNDDTLDFVFNTLTAKVGSLFISNSSVNFDTASTGRIYIRIDKTKLSSPDLQGFKQWLQANNVTVVYQLAEEKVYECINIDLITYANETNYIVESGAIAPKTTLKVHNNISNVVSLLQKKVSLLESNVKASQEVQDMMILETDMRMLDIELALMEFIPMKLNLGGSNMLRSATYFNFVKNHIINETYEKEYLENVMNKYLATGRINQDEYDELYKMLYPPVYDIELPIEL